MTAVMSIVATGSGAQIVFGLAVSMVFMKLLMMMMLLMMTATTMFWC